MKTKKIYHRNVYMPEPFLKLSEKTIALGEISKHASEKAEHRGIIIPETITFSGDNIIEAESTHNGGVKLVIRVEYDYNTDVCYVINFSDYYNKLVTVYLNNRYDEHYTLDESKYYHPTPEEIFS